MPSTACQCRLLQGTAAAGLCVQDLVHQEPFVGKAAIGAYFAEVRTNAPPRRRLLQEGCLSCHGQECRLATSPYYRILWLAGGAHGAARRALLR